MNKILITMGDPAGIGPEVILKYYKNYFNLEKTDYLPFLIGSRSILEYYMEKYNIKLEIEEIDDVYQCEDKNYEKKIYLINRELKMDKLEIGKATKYSGKYAMLYLEDALEFVKEGIFDAMTTAPISKDAINMAGYKYSGHTSFLADRTGIDNFGMILKGKKITVVLNTTHLSLEDAIKEVKKESILKKIILAEKAKEALGIDTKIAVAGLNPHNGENGLFGDQESQEIAPAVLEAQKMGIDVEGPIVPDSLFVKMLQDQYNIAVVMYHDQGLIPMKMESFGMGVNITIGLPIIRTSVDHGTAYDIAGEGIADFGSLNSAVSCANTIINNTRK